MKLWIALESDVLIHLVFGEENATASLDTIRQLNGFPLITPSVLRELADYKKSGSEEAFRGIAAKALACLNTLNILPHDLDDKDRAVALATARKMVGKNIVADLHTARVLAEASISKCRLLLTYGPAINVDRAALRLFWVENDLPDCFPLPPHWFVHYFGKKSGG